MSEPTVQSGQPPARWGILAEFDSAEALLHAAESVRDAGYRRFDVFSPYPIHGMDYAMGLGRSKLGWIVLLFGLAGAAAGMALQWYTNVVDYPLITDGKPYFSWQAFMPVTFEVMVLSAAFGALIGMLALNGLPAWYHPTLKHQPFLKASDNRFFLVIETADERFAEPATRELLEKIGGTSIVMLEE